MTATNHVLSGSAATFKATIAKSMNKASSTGGTTNTVLGDTTANQLPAINASTFVGNSTITATAPTGYTLYNDTLDLTIYKYSLDALMLDYGTDNDVISSTAGNDNVKVTFRAGQVLSDAIVVTPHITNAATGTAVAFLNNGAKLNAGAGAIDQAKDGFDVLAASLTGITAGKKYALVIGDGDTDASDMDDLNIYLVEEGTASTTATVVAKLETYTGLKAYDAVYGKSPATTGTLTATQADGAEVIHKITLIDGPATGTVTGTVYVTGASLLLNDLGTTAMEVGTAVGPIDDGSGNDIDYTAAVFTTSIAMPGSGNNIAVTTYDSTSATTKLTTDTVDTTIANSDGTVDLRFTKAIAAATDKNIVDITYKGSTVNKAQFAPKSLLLDTITTTGEYIPNLLEIIPADANAISLKKSATTDYDSCAGTGTATADITSLTAKSAANPLAYSYKINAAYTSGAAFTTAGEYYVSIVDSYKNAVKTGEIFIETGKADSIKDGAAIPAATTSIDTANGVGGISSNTKYATIAYSKADTDQIIFSTTTPGVSKLTVDVNNTDNANSL